MNTTADVKALKCPKCEGQLDVDETKESVKCPFCGTAYSVAELLKEGETFRIEKMRINALKEAESERVKREDAAEKKRE